MISELSCLASFSPSLFSFCNHVAYAHPNLSSPSNATNTQSEPLQPRNLANEEKPKSQKGKGSSKAIERKRCRDRLSQQRRRERLKEELKELKEMVINLKMEKKQLQIENNSLRSLCDTLSSQHQASQFNPNLYLPIDAPFPVAVSRMLEIYKKRGLPDIPSYLYSLHQPVSFTPAATEFTPLAAAEFDGIAEAMQQTHFPHMSTTDGHSHGLSGSAAQTMLTPWDGTDPRGQTQYYSMSWYPTVN